MPMRRLALVIYVAIALLAHGAVSMYADEAGKLDWHQENLGRFSSAGFDGRGGLTVLGEESRLASVNSQTGDLLWRRVLAPNDAILATSIPVANRATATLSGGGRTIRFWSPADGTLMWETVLAPEAERVVSPGEVAEDGEGEDLIGKGGATGGGHEGSGSSPRVVMAEGGHIVVLSRGGIHVLSTASGAVLAQWWSDPSREPDLAALVGPDAEVTFTSLREVPGRNGHLLAGGWTSVKGSSSEAQAFVVAEISPVERMVTFKASKVTKCPVDPSTGITLATSFGTSVGEESLAVVGLCKSGASLAVFKPTDGASSVVETLLPPGLFASSKKAAVELSDLSGSYGTVLVLRATEEWTSAAVTLSHAAPQGGAGHVSVVKGSDAEKEAWLCSPSGDDRSAGCILTGAVSPSGKVFVASASLFAEEGTSSSGASSGGDGSGRATRKSLVVKVAQFARFANNVVDETVASFVVSDLPSLGHGRQGAFEAAHLEARDKGDHCSPKDHPEACFRALMVNEDDSAMMVGREGVEWVREEALAAVDKVVFVDSSMDELALLAAAGQKVEHHTPSWQERYHLLYLELMAYLRSAVKSLTNVRLPGSELLENVDVSGNSFGLNKLAICTTKASKLYALDMLDGSVRWSSFLPFSAKDTKVLLYATRPKAILGYNPEVAVISQAEEHTYVSWRDGITGVETRSEMLPFMVTSSVPLAVKDSEDRSLIMVVDSEGGVHAVPTSEASSKALSELLPRLFYHNYSLENGLESFAVIKKASSSPAEGGDVLLSAPVASVPLPAGAKLVAKAYPDRRDTIQTPAHTLGDDSLIIKFINPRLLAVATLAAPTESGSGGSASGKGEILTVTLIDHVSGRILHRITHKGAAEPVHMVVSESWVVYTYWSAASQRTEMSTLSLYEGMIDKYGLGPFNRPEWKEAFSSFESRVPIVTQKTFIFPYPVTALSVTVTQRGITAKNLLIGTAHGQVVMLDRRFLDPRRPIEEPSKIEKEEKLVQYQPYLPVVPTQILSYYKVIEGVSRIFTEPTGLESTTLLLAVGLDLFGSRVAPSKTYDRLDPNFNYALLVIVLVAMAAAVTVTGRFAASKRLKDQWA